MTKNERPETPHKQLFKLLDKMRGDPRINQMVDLLSFLLHLNRDDLATLTNLLTELLACGARVRAITLLSFLPFMGGREYSVRVLGVLEKLPNHFRGRMIALLGDPSMPNPHSSRASMTTLLENLQDSPYTYQAIRVLYYLFHQDREVFATLVNSLAMLSVEDRTKAITLVSFLDEMGEPLVQVASLLGKMDQVSYATLLKLLDELPPGSRIRMGYALAGLHDESSVELIDLLDAIYNAESQEGSA